MAESTARRLTSFSTCAGCAGKLAPLEVAQILDRLPRGPRDPNLLVATETSDDAGVYQVAPGLALVQTVDFFPPLLDDPYAFGQIAAANALSDVYAMNGRPITALNLVGFPDRELSLDVLGEILRGGAERVAAAGAVIVGGHSLRDSEVKYGLSVTGLVDPSEVLTNATARPGDCLVLTKPLGTGFVTTANKKDACPAGVLERAVASMIQLNAIGRDALRAAGGAHALTDITGFGLSGHAAEMAEGSGVTLGLESRAFPMIEGSQALANPSFHNRASSGNRRNVEARLRIEPGADALGLEYLFDAQTSGGLLIAIDPGHVERLIAELASRGAAAAARIGTVLPREGSLALVVR